MTEASELEQAIAVIERAVAQSIPNAQTAAWATIRPALLAALRDAERLNWVRQQFKTSTEAIDNATRASSVGE